MEGAAFADAFRAWDSPFNILPVEEGISAMGT